MSKAKYFVVASVAAVLATANVGAAYARDGQSEDSSTHRSSGVHQEMEHEDKDDDNHKNKHGNRGENEDKNKHEDNHQNKHDDDDDHDGRHNRGRDHDEDDDKHQGKNKTHAKTQAVAGTSTVKTGDALPATIPSTGIESVIGGATGLGALTYAASSYLQSRRLK